ncbi:MAG TPA: prepilin-type N-terminal cleavage/methylation domain-containing protein [bacterium]|jgi:prepilin-type N-terminal cleavage/methylation domain-containing protein|nr:prepilin-type N-terminal cleavage/methylation domain-containing protein [bacterium]
MRNLGARLRRLDQRGYSLIELMFVVGIAGIAIASVVRFTFTSRLNLSRQEVATDLYNSNARIGSNLRADLASAKLMLANYNGAHDMTALMNLVRASVTADGAPAPVAFTLPATVANMNDPDLTGTAAATWGDELMYIAEVGPVTFTAQDAFAGGCTCSASSYAVERYQIVYDYLTNQKTGTLPDLGKALRLVQWRSAPFIDVASVENPAVSSRSNEALSVTCATLLAAGYSTAIDVNNTQALTTAFYTILSPTGSVSTFVTPVAPTSLSQSSWAFIDDYDSLQSYSAQPNKNWGQISRSGGFGSIASPYTKSVAYNTKSSGSSGSPVVNVLDAPGKQLAVPQYALVDNAVSGYGGGAGFPGGFEVAIMGPLSQRQIYMRRVLMSSSATKPGGTPKTYIAHEAVDEVTILNNNY